jgi:hypothetical protein
MIPEQSNIEIARSNNFKSSRSKIVATVSLKKILRNSLYTNKILSCIREIGLNAFDSHVEAGCKERPISLFLKCL